MSDEVESKIYLTYLNGTGYVFDKDDYIKLRAQYRIVGNFVGTACESNGYCLPAELSTLETRLLVDDGIAVLVSKTASLLCPPTAAELDAYQASIESRITAQADALKGERLREAERNMQHILAGKRRKLERAGESNALITPAKVLHEIGEQFMFERNNALIEITCAHAEQHEARIVELEPPTPLESLKYRVLRDYWKLGKYVTPGDAFGADFLIYPGDPMFYHASHIVVVVEEPKKIQLISLISKIRLSVVVNKSYVIAYAAGDPADNIVHYQTIKWDGNNGSRIFEGRDERCDESRAELPSSDVT